MNANLSVKNIYNAGFSLSGGYKMYERMVLKIIVQTAWWGKITSNALVNNNTLEMELND